MNKKLKTTLIVCIIIIIGAVVTFAYIECTNYIKESNNKTNNVVTGMNENNNIIIEGNNIIENDVVENNIEKNNLENNIEENKNQNIESKEEIETEKQNVSPNNDSELESNNDEEKAIEIVKKDWGSSDGVYFKIQEIDSNGNYIVSVNNSETTASLAWYTVNPKTGEFTN